MRDKRKKEEILCFWVCFILLLSTVSIFFGGGDLALCDCNTPEIEGIVTTSEDTDKYVWWEKVKKSLGVGLFTLFVATTQAITFNSIGGLSLVGTLILSSNNALIVYSYQEYLLRVFINLREDRISLVLKAIKGGNFDLLGPKVIDPCVSALENEDYREIYRIAFELRDSYDKNQALIKWCYPPEYLDQFRDLIEILNQLFS